METLDSRNSTSSLHWFAQPALDSDRAAPAQVAEFSLLIRWQGSNTALNPVLFVSHLDVVPATEGDSSEWSRPPFGGDIHDK